MSTQNDSRRGDSKPKIGVCATEGCGRPADGLHCDACELERFLFDREARTADEAPRIRRPNGPLGPEA